MKQMTNLTCEENKPGLRDEETGIKDKDPMVSSLKDSFIILC